MAGIPGIVIPNSAQVAALTMGDAPVMAQTVMAEAPRASDEDDLGAEDAFIAVVDYHKGNLMSVERGLRAAGARALITDDPALIARAAAAVVPGVGAFDDAMTFMRASGQADAVCTLARSGVPVLGICLGMQLFFTRGNEHAQAPRYGEEPAWTQGLDLIDGEVTRLPADKGVKVPHVGWNSVHLTKVGARCPLFEGVPDETYFYFTHSYVCAPAEEGMVAAATEHGVRFASAAWDGNVLFGVQFHPEKSSAAGQAVLRNFARIVAGTRERSVEEFFGDPAAPDAVSALGGTDEAEAGQ